MITSRSSLSSNEVITHFREKKLIGISTGADFSVVGGDPDGVGAGGGMG